MGLDSCTLVLEPYSPHRCAHQLGYDQTIPSPIQYPRDIQADLLGLSRAWSSILERHTESSFEMIKSFHQPHFSSEYQRWYYQAITSIDVPKIVFDSHLAEGEKRAQQRPRREVRELRQPDFAGREHFVDYESLLSSGVPFFQRLSLSKPFLLNHFPLIFPFFL